ncbi:unnamed protein product [Effrenium voratum]|nr:unnamed protein product [Effrenium voratum]
MDEVLIELRRIHQNVVDKTRLQKFIAPQPVMSWKSFTDECIVLENLPKYSTGPVALNLFVLQRALLGDEMPATGTSSALLMAYQKVKKPLSKGQRYVSLVLTASVYFCGRDCLWNIFDVGLSLVAVSEIILNILFFSMGSTTKAALILRGLRLARMARLAKLMRLCHQCRHLRVHGDRANAEQIRAESECEVMSLGFRATVQTVSTDALSKCGYLPGIATDPRNTVRPVISMLNATCFSEVFLAVIACRVASGHFDFNFMTWSAAFSVDQLQAANPNLPLHLCVYMLRRFTLGCELKAELAVTLRLPWRSLRFEAESNPVKLQVGYGDSFDLDPGELPRECKLHYMYGEEYCGSVFGCMFSIFRCMIGDCTTKGGRSLTMIFSDGFGLRFDIFYAFSMVIFGLFNIITAIFVEATLRLRLEVWVPGNGLKENEAHRRYAKAYESTYMTEQLAKLVMTSVLPALLGGTVNQLGNTVGQLGNLVRSVEPRPGIFEAFNTEEDGTVSVSELVCRSQGSTGSGLMRLRGDLHKVDLVIAQMTLEQLGKLGGARSAAPLKQLRCAILRASTAACEKAEDSGGETAKDDKLPARAPSMAAFEKLTWVWKVIAQRLEVEASERTAAISRLSAYIDGAIEGLTAKIEAVTQASVRKAVGEEAPLAPTGLEELKRSIARLSEGHGHQEERLRSLAHKVDEVSGTQTILDRDQKATFRELSNSISDLNIKLGSRASRRVPEQRGGSIPRNVARQRSMASDRFEQLVAELCKQHAAELRELREANAQLQKTKEGEEEEGHVLSPEWALDCRVEASESVTLPPQQEVQVQIHAVRCLPTAGNKGRCKLVVRGEKETPWAELSKEEGIPGALQEETWDAVWDRDAGALSCTIPADREPLVPIELFLEGQTSAAASCRVPLGERRHCNFDNGGFLDAEVKLQSELGQVEPPPVVAPSVVRGQPPQQKLGVHSSTDGVPLSIRLEELFNVTDVSSKVVMPADLYLAMQAGRKKMWNPLNMLSIDELEEALKEFRRIHGKVFSNGRRASISQAVQPVMSWTAFRDMVLLEDLPNLVSSACVTWPGFVLLGFSLDLASDSVGWVVVEAIFSTIFVSEIAIKSYVFTPRTFFCGKDRWWNGFDSLLTAVAVGELLLNLVINNESQAKIVLILRGLRFARIARLAKLMHMPLLQELANIVSGFIISARSLFWVIVTLNVVVYVCALALRSMVQSWTEPNTLQRCGSGDYMDMEGAEGPCKLHLVYGDEYCGSVLRCMFSIFRCMIGDCTSAGGRSLTMIFSHGFGLRFDLLYALSMVVVLFGLFNIITAIFVEATLSGLKENEVQRKYAKAFETNYMTEQLAKLVMCVSVQTENLRARTGARLEAA